MERASRGLVMNAWRFLREIGLTKIRRISNIRSVFATCGALAQLGERNTGSVEVSGSIPLGSTKFQNAALYTTRRFLCSFFMRSPHPAWQGGGVLRVDFTEQQKLD